MHYTAYRNPLDRSEDFISGVAFASQSPIRTERRSAPPAVAMRIKPGRGLLGARGRPPGKGSRPLAPANSKEGTLGKRVRRGALSVQLAFRAANRSRVQLVLGAFATVAFILIMIALLPASPLFSPGTCACPATAMARTRLLALAKTALVARIGAAGELNPLAMLLGPPGLLRHPLALAPADVSGCGELPAGVARARPARGHRTLGGCKCIGARRAAAWMRTGDRVSVVRVGGCRSALCSVQ